MLDVTPLTRSPLNRVSSACASSHLGVLCPQLSPGGAGSIVLLSSTIQVKAQVPVFLQLNIHTLIQFGLSSALWPLFYLDDFSASGANSKFPESYHF